MTIQIKNETEFKAAIDAYGDAQAKIEALNAEQKIRKQLLETYANKEGIKKFATDAYRLTMKRGTPALRAEKGREEKDIVALLKADETARDFITPTYDSVAIKSYVDTLEDPDEWLAQHGLLLTGTVPHAIVKAL